MNALEIAQRSFDAWNRHDAHAIVDLYAEGATYHNPRFDHPLKGHALADFAKSVWTTFPDMSLEIISCGDTGGGLVATQLKP
jgi:ketosteroid isomerase-like protein